MDDEYDDWYYGEHDHEVEDVEDGWDYLAEAIPRAYEGQLKNFSHAETRIFGAEQMRYALKWYTLLTPWPEGVELIVEGDIDDICINGLFGLPASRQPVATLLTNERRYLQLGDRRWKIQDYRQRAEPEKPTYYRVDAVQMVEPPDWGWWMPVLWGI